MKLRPEENTERIKFGECQPLPEEEKTVCFLKKFGHQRIFENNSIFCRASKSIRQVHQELLKSSS